MPQSVGEGDPNAERCHSIKVIFKDKRPDGGQTEACHCLRLRQRNSYALTNAEPATLSCAIGVAISSWMAGTGWIKFSCASTTGSASDSGKASFPFALVGRCPSVVAGL